MTQAVEHLPNKHEALNLSHICHINGLTVPWLHTFNPIFFENESCGSNISSNLCVPHGEGAPRILHGPNVGSISDVHIFRRSKHYHCL
jgi:hypothetical protein